MDPDIISWIYEFLLLQQPFEDTTLIKLLRALPPSNDDHNLKKLFLLRRLESHIAAAGNSVSVRTLELLGQMGTTEFLIGNGNINSETLKNAFCAVAVDCTMNCIRGRNGEDKSKGFLEAMCSIWKEKINKITKLLGEGGLCSETLWAWRNEFAVAMWDDEAFDSKAEGINGMEAVKCYIKEEREKMRPSFLELLAERVKTDVILQGIMGVEGINQDNEINKGKKKVREDDEMTLKVEGVAAANMGNTPKQKCTPKSVGVKKRRPYKKWSPEEESALRAGVEMIGAGRWMDILKYNRDQFNHTRTSVDLKDKWKNMNQQ